MYNIALEILKILNKNNFEAYIIGGYPRDLYLGIESKDIDICTNAKYKNFKQSIKQNGIKTELRRKKISCGKVLIS